jgi:hypothetical protein
MSETNISFFGANKTEIKKIDNGRINSFIVLSIKNKASEIKLFFDSEEELRQILERIDEFLSNQNKEIKNPV